jgi:TPR repeat protein
MRPLPALFFSLLLVTALPLTASAASPMDRAVQALERGDFETAVSELRPLAEHGDDQAQFYLGSMYATGSGVEKDESKAIQWLTRSAAQRNTRAMGMLAVALFSRARDDQDLVDAYAWSHLAAALDPIQATTSARSVIARYCDEEQKKRGEQAISDWKQKWSSEGR